MDSNLSPLLAIFIAIALGATSPGPSFVLVARTAVAQSRADGLAAALGMGTGGVVFAIKFGWYAFVALALSSPAPCAAYLRGKTAIDRLAGGIMAAFGIRLITSQN